jgi:hypothetical protein
MSKELPIDHVKPLIDGYQSGGTKTMPPSAAKFGVGATTLEQIKQATDARREHSRQLSEAGKEFAARPTAARPDMAPPKP